MIGADFHRRVLEPCLNYPYSLLIFAKEPPWTRCEERKALAQKLLATPNTNLEINALKTKLAFTPELEEIARTGQMPRDFFL
eukprot:1287541-Lingulodinium_polyedra.AAC.1